MKRKIFNLVLVILMAMVFSPIKGFAETVDEYQIWVGGVQITESNKNDVLGETDEGATVIYNSDTQTLTLSNASIMDGKKINQAINETVRVAIYSTIDLNIVLKGNNILGEIDETKYSPTNGYSIGGYSINYGIWADTSNLTFLESDESGTLNIVDYTDGIKANDITFDNKFGKLIVNDMGNEPMQDLPPCTISAEGDVVINGGIFELKSELQNGITANKVIINGGLIKIWTNSDKNTIYSNDVIIIDDNMEVINAEYIKETTSQLSVSDITVDDGFVTIKEIKKVDSFTYNIITGDKQELTINDIKSFILKIDGDYSLFQSLKVGELDLIKEEDYTVTEGSTVIIFTDKGISKLNTLSKGEYEILIKYTNDKEVKGKLTLKQITTPEPEIENPNTYDSICINLFIGVVSLIGFIIITLYLRKRKYSIIN